MEPDALPDLPPPDPESSPSLDLLLSNARRFHELHPSPVQDNLMVNLPDEPHDQHAAATRVVVHARVLEFIDRFLEYKRLHGTAVEQDIYRNMTRPEFIARLICKRPLSFLGPSDRTLLRTEIRPKGSDWKLVGTAEEKQSSIQMASYLSYDEMAISAMIGVSSPTTFINSGGRYNEGKRGPSCSYISHGVVIGLCGCRFHHPDRMESQFIVVRRPKGKPKYDEGLRAIWAWFYGTPSFPTHEEARHAFEAGSERFSRLGPNFFDADIFKKRITITLETAFADANDRALSAGKRAYVHLVGLGLGVWKVHGWQTRWFVDAVADVLQRVAYPNVAIVDFAWFKLSPATCGDVSNGGTFQAPNGNAVQIQFSERDPASPLCDVDDEDVLLFSTYAWDGNAFPGNEIYLGSLSSSGDPAAAACCTIYELHNPYINPYYAKVFTAGEF
ncbi:protein of unknown function (DUF4804) [Plasmodiophora brassicae]